MSESRSAPESRVKELARLIIDEHPLPWRVYPALGAGDRGFVRDANGRTLFAEMASENLGVLLLGLVTEASA